MRQVELAAAPHLLKHLYNYGHLACPRSLTRVLIFLHEGCNLLIQAKKENCIQHQRDMKSEDEEETIS
jgi:hypothetical protein